MAEIERPFSTFNFRVELQVPGGQIFCNAEFSECDGLEVTLTPQTIREGGNNSRPIHLLGPVAYGQLALKRGITRNLDLLPQNRARDRALTFTLTGCLPTKLKVPALNAKDGQIAIEEMNIAYERLQLVPPGA
jgi:hypothetical protein